MARPCDAVASAVPVAPRLPIPIELLELIAVRPLEVGRETANRRPPAAGVRFVPALDDGRVTYSVYQLIQPYPAVDAAPERAEQD